MQKTVIIGMAVLSLLLVSGCSQTDTVAEFKGAISLYSQKDYPAAAEKAKLCVRIDREDVEAIKLYALCVYSYDSKKAEREEALKNLKRAAKMLAQDDYELHYFLGWAQFQDYNYAEAQETLEMAYKLLQESNRLEAMKTSKMYAHLLYMLGLCYVQSNLEKGLGYLNVLKGVAPYNTWTEYYCSYAILAYRLKNYPEAISWYQQAIKLDKSRPEPYLNIAVIYDTVYRKPMARTWYIHALANYQKQNNAYYAEMILNRLRSLAAMEKR